MIDLGSDLVFEVKYADKVYAMREPTAKEMNDYHKKIRSDKDQENAVQILIDFVESLGMPKEVAEKLPSSKLNALVQGLVDGMSKKN